jgi:hypothetical protein
MQERSCVAERRRTVTCRMIPMLVRRATNWLLNSIYLTKKSSKSSNSKTDRKDSHARVHLHVSDTDAPLVDAFHRAQWTANRPIGSGIFKPVQLHFLPACTFPIFPPLPCRGLHSADWLNLPPQARFTTYQRPCPVNSCLKCSLTALQTC